jgi:hypothetical protein
VREERRAERASIVYQLICRERQTLEPKVMMMMSLRTVVLEQPVALGVSLLVMCIAIYGVQWAMGRKRFIDVCNRLPGPSISGYSPWLCHLQPFIESLDTIPGYPGIPQSFSVFCKYYQDSGK